MQRGLLSSTYLHPEKIINWSLMQQLSAFMELLKQWWPLEAGMEGGLGMGKDAPSELPGLLPEGQQWLNWSYRTIGSCFHLKGEPSWGWIGSAGKMFLEEDSVPLTPSFRIASATFPTLICKKQRECQTTCRARSSVGMRDTPHVCRDLISGYKWQQWREQPVAACLCIRYRAK